MSATKAPACSACGREIRPGAGFCPHCGAKRTAIAGGTVRTAIPGIPRWLIVTALCAIGLFTYLFVEHLPGGDHPVIAEQPAVPVTSPGLNAEPVPVVPAYDGEHLTIPLSSVRENRIVEFEYSDGTLTVPLLAFVTGEGKLVTSYRMCEPCNSKKFSIEGDRLSCGNCETQWSLNTLEGLQGTCQKYPPEPFPSRIEGDLVVMSIAQIRNWQIRL